MGKYETVISLNLQVELSCPKEMAWKVNMHRGYLAICHPEEQQLNFIERLVEMASSLAIREWRRLPHIVSHVHTPLLQVSYTKPFLSLSGRCNTRVKCGQISQVAVIRT